MIQSYEEQLADNVYFDRSFKLETAKLLPGEYYVTDRNMMLVTVLGSCVAACVRDPRHGIGGMNHFMLPDVAGDGDSPVSNSARYGTYAMEILINQLIKLGARREALEAKVFGGGNVLRGLTIANVGQRNADFVLEFLAAEQIPVRGRDLVGEWPRKVHYFPADGRVLMKKLQPPMHNDTIYVREVEYRSRLVTAKVAGVVELYA